MISNIKPFQILQLDQDVSSVPVVVVSSCFPCTLTELSFASLVPDSERILPLVRSTARERDA